MEDNYKRMVEDAEAARKYYEDNPEKKQALTDAWYSPRYQKPETIAEKVIEVGLKALILVLNTLYFVGQVVVKTPICVAKTFLGMPL